LVLLKVAMKEKEKDLIKYKNRFHISFPLLMDENASVENAYGVLTYPATFFINREGKIVGRVSKEDVDWTSGSMKNLIRYLLDEKT
jgi:peroxiredoxin